MDWAPTQNPSSKLIHVPYSGWLPLPSKEFPLYGEQGLKQCQFFFYAQKEANMQQPVKAVPYWNINYWEKNKWKGRKTQW